MASSPFSDPRERSNKALLLDAYLNEVTSNPPRLDASQSMQGRYRIPESVPRSSNNVHAAETYTRRTIHHHDASECRDLKFSKPTDTVLGIAGSNSSGSTCSSLSSSLESNRIGSLFSFDASAIQGIGAWSKTEDERRCHQLHTLGIHPANEAEAQAIAGKALRAQGKYFPVFDEVES